MDHKETCFLLLKTLIYFYLFAKVYFFFIPVIATLLYRLLKHCFTIQIFKMAPQLLFIKKGFKKRQRKYILPIKLGISNFNSTGALRTWLRQAKWLLFEYLLTSKIIIAKSWRTVQSHVLKLKSCFNTI